MFLAVGEVGSVIGTPPCCARSRRQALTMSGALADLLAEITDGAGAVGTLLQPVGHGPQRAS